MTRVEAHPLGEGTSVREPRLQTEDVARILVAEAIAGDDVAEGLPRLVQEVTDGPHGLRRPAALLFRC